MVPPTVGQNADFLEEIKVQQVLLTFQAEHAPSLQGT